MPQAYDVTLIRLSLPLIDILQNNAIYTHMATLK